jgi:methionine-S-sulfoxide reductase
MRNLLLIASFFAVCSLHAIGSDAVPSKTQPSKTQPSEATKRFESAKGETAAFAAGCFWGTEEFFRKIPGVMATRVGYEGGEKPAGYADVKMGSTGHAETLELKYDPKKVTYEHLLDQFFKMHDPTTMNRQGNDQGTQYRSEIFTYTPEQSKEASAFMAKVEKSKAWKAPITTKVEPAKTFFEAEDYHQQYLIKNPGGYDNHHLRNLNFDSSSK